MTISSNCDGLLLHSSRPSQFGVAAVLAGGCGLLVLRPLLWQGGGDPTGPLVVLFTALLVVGLAGPATTERRPATTGLAAVALGVAAFALGRVLGGGEAPLPFAAKAVVLNGLAALAEEAFFRRLAYSALAPAGAAVAVGGTAVLFALVHVTVYGAWVLPIDLGAGLVLSWQRWASGDWRAPAITHLLANLMVVI